MHLALSANLATASKLVDRIPNNIDDVLGADIKVGVALAALSGDAEYILSIVYDP